MMDEYKKAAEILEMMTEEPEPGHEARLDADELDAVLLAIKVLKAPPIKFKPKRMTINKDTVVFDYVPLGKWDEIREPFGWDDILSARCSTCGESYPYPEETGFNDIVEMFKYCPNCGAKMEAGDRWKEEET